MMKSTITLPNGTKVTCEGTPKEVQETIAKLGGDTGDTYNSSSRGKTPIALMATPHITNAICKKYREWAASLSHLPTKALLLDKIRRGPDDSEMLALLKELQNR